MTVDSFSYPTSGPPEGFETALSCQVRDMHRIEWWHPDVAPAGGEPRVVPYTGVTRARLGFEQAINAVNDALAAGTADHDALRERIETASIALTEAFFGRALAGTIAKLAETGRITEVWATAQMQEPEWPLEFCLLAGTAAEGGPDSFHFHLGARCDVVRVVPQQPWRAAAEPENAADTIEAAISAGAGLDLNFLGYAAQPRERTIAYAEDGELASACLVPGRPDPRRRGVEEVFALEPIAPGLSAVSHVPPVVTRTPGLRVAFEPAINAQIVHVNAHSDILTTPADGRLRFLQVRDRFQLTAPLLQSVFARETIAAAFVFLNACNSAFGAPGLRNSLAVWWLHQGAAVVVCGIGPVQDDVARQFACRFYEAFANDGISVAKALRTARAELAKDIGLPLGLLYTLLGDARFVLPAGGSPREGQHET